MKLLSLLFFFALGIGGCGDNALTSTQAKMHAKKPQSPDKHNYFRKDGDAYIYKVPTTKEEMAEGSQAVMMKKVKFLGSKDGKYQAYIVENGLMHVMECAGTCQEIKIMIGVLDKGISSHVMQASPDTLATKIMEDAIENKLDPITGEENGKEIRFWYDEKLGAKAIRSETLLYSSPQLLKK